MRLLKLFYNWLRKWFDPAWEEPDWVEVDGYKMGKTIEENSKMLEVERKNEQAKNT